MPESSEIARTAIERIGCDPDNLGFVGLKVELPPEYREALEPEWAYTSPSLQYVRGYQGQPHITIIYGLLFSAADNRDLVDGVLEKWYEPNVVLFEHVEAFDGDDDYGLYSAIVLTLGEWQENSWAYAELKMGNDELRRLPHVNGFPVYKPHITVGYVKREFKDLAIGRIQNLQNRPLRTTGLEYT